ncbi:TetR/AcrR family transcriptional regulator [Kribbella capetownensis]|uniref:TetR/AcrR family transcriptional regulator n=1 Tax=Kribbella capetownensis TaxID=1572659 RepID=A0A4R0K0S0_9ACTN|nr:TetR/AcrR family transcriptional regulator [Kribbella capetownensis]TCC53511.1 TetR/AcrR family transcriptional regulator [Kribbella capetownensis]
MATPMGRRTGRPRAVTEQAILDAALWQLDGGGADAVSIRGIAAQVGIAPNAVYTYFPSKAAVLRALVERFLGDVNHDRFIDRELPWRERVEALALELRTHLVAHRGAVQLLLGGPMDGPNALTLRESLSEALADGGSTPDDAARASYVLLVYIFGAIALEVAELDQRRIAPTERDRVSTRRAVLDTISAEDYPRTTETAGTISKDFTTEQFLWGLTRILNGLQA